MRLKKVEVEIRRSEHGSRNKKVRNERVRNKKVRNERVRTKVRNKRVRNKRARRIEKVWYWDLRGAEVPQ